MLRYARFCLGTLALSTMVFVGVGQVGLPDTSELERQQLETNKAVVGRFYDELFNEGNLTVADEIISPEFVDPIDRVTTGPDSLKNVVSLFHGAFPDMKISYELWAEGDVVIAKITSNMGTYQGGLDPVFDVPDSTIGQEVVLQGVDFARIKGGQFVEAWVVHDNLNWL